MNEMEKLGARYGEGLQLINILRDAGSDLRAGRCYLPNEDLNNAGLTPSQVLEQPARVQPVFRKWLDRADDGLKAGMKYSLAIGNRRVRAATALPALIGIRTVALLRDAGQAVLEEKIKIPRDEVRRMLRKVALSLASKRTLQRLFERE
jgi:farnesyl-diphosphate farnesyltransferase